MAIDLRTEAQKKREAERTAKHNKVVEMYRDLVTKAPTATVNQRLIFIAGKTGYTVQGVRVILKNKGII